MQEDDAASTAAARTAAARREFIIAYCQGKLEELRLEIKRLHNAEASRIHLKGNLRAVKDGAYSPRVIRCLEQGSYNEFGQLLARIRQTRDARKARNKTLSRRHIRHTGPD